MMALQLSGPRGGRGRRLARAGLAWLALALAACSPTYDWREWSPEGAGWAVLLPGRPAAATREILLGTRAGEIYEAVLVAPPGGDLDEGDFLDRLTRRTAGGSSSGPEIDRVLRHVFTLPEQQAATGLAAEPLTGSSKGKGKAVVIITTSTRIYEILGPLGKSKKDESEGESLYDALFEPYRGDAAPPLREYSGALMRWPC